MRLPNLCGLLSLLFSIVMEFANNGDLAYRIEDKKKKNELFSESEIWDIFIQIVKGLNSLHQLNIFHRDIKVLLYLGSLLMFSCTNKMEWFRRSLETWMFPRYRRRGYVWPRQGLLTTPALRFGRINPTTLSPIYGHWVAFCIRWSLSSLLSGPKTWRGCTRKLQEESIHAFLNNIPRTWVRWLEVCFKSVLKWGHRAVVFE